MLAIPRLCVLGIFLAALFLCSAQVMASRVLLALDDQSMRSMAGSLLGMALSSMFFAALATASGYAVLKLPRRSRLAWMLAAGSFVIVLVLLGVELQIDLHRLEEVRQAGQWGHSALKVGAMSAPLLLSLGVLCLPSVRRFCRIWPAGERSSPRG